MFPGSMRNPPTASAVATTPAAISHVPASRPSPIAVASAVKGPLGLAPAGSTGWNGEPGRSRTSQPRHEPGDREHQHARPPTTRRRASARGGTRVGGRRAEG